MYRILIVEDDEVIASEIVNYLSRWELEGCIAKDLSNIVAEFESVKPQLVLMDVSLPFYNGFFWCQEIRKIADTPVIFLSSRNENMDIVMAMNMGGDDYIAKPASMEVLLAKVQAMLRRAYNYKAEPSITLHGAIFDPAALYIDNNGQRISLTPNEAKLLSRLVSARGSVVTREELMISLWNSDQFIDDNTLSVNMNRLRHKLESAGLEGCIVTHKSKGYAIDG